MNELDDLKEELFCTKYELDALTQILLNGKAERWVPSFTGTTKDEDHIKRYEIALRYVKGLVVLDIACGAGKGSHLLAKNGLAKTVIGGDVDADSIRYARHRFADANVSFRRIDGMDFSLEEDLDMVISFETIEHIQLVQVFLKNVWNTLKKEGKFIVSTPISAIPLDKNPLNPYHVQEWGFEEFHKVLKEGGFEIEKIYVQLDHRLPGPTIFRRLKKRLFNKKGNRHHYTGYSDKKIEEFNGQYDVEEFGKTRNGFQIVVCKKTVLPQ